MLSEHLLPVTVGSDIGILSSASYAELIITISIVSILGVVTRFAIST
jgi:hypothetical protein